MHDRLGNLLQSTDHLTNTTLHRIYDPKGRLLIETLPNNLHFENTYDTQGRRTQIQLPDHSLITYTYDALNLRSITHNTYTHHFTSYDLSGNLLTEDMIENHGTITHTYDLTGRHTSYHSPYFTQKILQYDPIGNILKSQYNNETLSYTYDALYQLTSEKNHTYTYDPYYNRLQKDNITYTLNNLNQIPSHFTYNPDGNPISHQNAHYTYDAFDRLITYEDEHTHITYTYDSLHRRISKTQNGQTTYYLYDNQNEIGSTDSSYNIQELRILGRNQNAEIASAIALELNGKIYAPLHDLHGNLATIISHNFQESYQYTAFGEPLTTSSLSPWRFSSKRHDPETNLIYFGRRYYLPTLGRWLTPDPKGFTDTPNLYAFNTNNPLTHLDLYGLESLLTYESFFFQSSPSTFPSIEERERSLIFWNTSTEAIWGFPKSENFNLQSITDYPLKKIPGIGLGYTPGICTDRELCVENTRYISNLSGSYDIEVTHIPSGGFGNDIARCMANLNLVVTDSAQMIKSKWMNHFKIYPDGRWLEICHSGGTGAVHLALLMLEPHLRAKIDILAIAPSVFIERGLCNQAINYASKSDFVPKLHKIMGKMQDIEKDSNVIYLDRHPNANQWDHGIQSPTYRPLLESDTRRFIFNKGFK